MSAKPSESAMAAARNVLGHTTRCSFGMEMGGTACRCGAGSAVAVASAIDEAVQAERKRIRELVKCYVGRDTRYRLLEKIICGHNLSDECNCEPDDDDVRVRAGGKP